MITIVKKILGYKTLKYKSDGSYLPPKIEFKNDRFYIKDKEYRVTSLEKIKYGYSNIVNDTKCYMKLYFHTKKNSSLQVVSCSLEDINGFINMMRRSFIPVLPTILNHGSPVFIAHVASNHFFSCTLEEKGLVTFLKNENSIFCFFNPLNEVIYTEVNTLDEIDLKFFLENPKVNLKKPDDSCGEFFENVKFRLVVLDKLLTLNRGYGVYPISNNEIIAKDIFYSFDEDEIKREIMELFEKYNILD